MNFCFILLISTYIFNLFNSDKPDFITFSLLTAVLQSNRSDVVFKRAPDVDSLATLNQMLYEKFQVNFSIIDMRNNGILKCTRA